MKLTIEGATYEGSPNEIMELLESMGVKFPVNEDREDEPNLKKGDKVRALAKGEFNNVRKDEIGTVEATDAGSEFDEYGILVQTDDNFDYFRPQDLEKVEDEEETNFPFKTGDYAKIISLEATSKDRGWPHSSIKVGDIVRLEEYSNKSTSKGFKVRKLDGSPINDRNVVVEDLAPVSDKEVERAVKFAKLGREPGEIKEGDIVRVTGSNYGHQVGTFGELVPAKGAFGKYPLVLANGVTKSHLGQMELIAPVESRVDIDA